jgi:lipopolysaccharide biosynthesis glycosyltransferase
MIFALCVDDNYFEQACAVISSIRANHSEITVKIYLIGMKLNKPNIEMITTLQNELLEVIYIEFSSSRYSSFGIRSHVSLAAYVRLELPDMLIKESKVMYLDADLVVMKPLDKIWDTDITNKPAAAVENPFFDRHKQLLMDENSKYFNSGVMLINLDFFREFNIAEKAFNFVVENEHNMVFHDQDALNHAINGNWVELPIECNFQTFFIRKFHRFSKQKKKSIKAALKSPLIIHYSSGIKPWGAFDPHPYRKSFLVHYKGAIEKPSGLEAKLREVLRLLYVKSYYFWHLGFIRADLN